MEGICVSFLDPSQFFRFIKGRCHGNQLILGKCHKRRQIPLAFFALSLENELQYHCLNVRINSRDGVAISCKNLVNFCWVTPDITEFAYLDTCIWRKLTYTSAFVVLPFRNAMEHWNFDGRINSVNDQAIPGINLVGF